MKQTEVCFSFKKKKKLLNFYNSNASYIGSMFIIRPLREREREKERERERETLQYESNTMSAHLRCVEQQE